MRNSLFLALAMLSWSVAVQAQSTNPKLDSGANSRVNSGINEARERFRRGVELFHEGSLDASLAELQRAYDLAPNYRLLYNLGQVQTERHDYVAALKFFDAYLEQGGSDLAADRRKQVETTQAQLRSRVASLVIQAGTSEIELSVDGIPVGKLPQANPVLINAGVHQLELRKEGYDSVTHTLTIAGSETVRLELPMRAQRREAALARRVERSRTARADEPTSTSTAPEAAVEASRASPSQAPLWTSLFATAALGGGALAFGLLARSADTDLQRELDQYPADRARVGDLRSQIHRDAALCDGLAAGAIVAASLSLYFALSSSGSSESSARAAAPNISANARGFSLELAF